MAAAASTATSGRWASVRPSATQAHGSSAARRRATMVSPMSAKSMKPLRYARRIAALAFFVAATSSPGAMSLPFSLTTIRVAMVEPSRT